MEIGEKMTQTFSTWTEYDNWLVKNYEQYALTSVNEENGAVTAEFIEKSEWEARQRREEAEAATAQTEQKGE